MNGQSSGVVQTWLTNFDPPYVFDGVDSPPKANGKAYEPTQRIELPKKKPATGRLFAVIHPRAASSRISHLVQST